MTRKVAIEMLRRLIYGGQPTDDAEITIGLTNQWMNPAIAVAAQKNYTDSIKLDGISYVNSSFYSTFKGIAVTKDENFLWKVQLPQIPVGIGQNEGVSTLVFKNSGGQISYPVIWMNQNQVAYQKGMKEIPNKILGYLKGEFAYVLSTILLSQYTATVTMISGGTSTDLQSTVNIPPDYFPIMAEYIKQQLGFQRMQPQDTANDGLDKV